MRVWVLAAITVVISGIYVSSCIDIHEKKLSTFQGTGGLVLQGMDVTIIRMLHALDTYNPTNIFEMMYQKIAYLVCMVVFFILVALVIFLRMFVDLPIYVFSAVTLELFNWAIFDYFPVIEFTKATFNVTQILESSTGPPGPPGMCASHI